MILLPLPEELLDQKVRGADIDREEGIEILNRHALERSRVRDPGVQYENVQALADELATTALARAALRP
jgi:hypothetical protein